MVYLHMCPTTSNKFINVVLHLKCSINICWINTSNLWHFFKASGSINPTWESQHVMQHQKPVMQFHTEEETRLTMWCNIYFLCHRLHQVVMQQKTHCANEDYGLEAKTEEIHVECRRKVMAKGSAYWFHVTWLLNERRLQNKRGIRGGS